MQGGSGAAPARATIAIASGKGGVGKSTVALNLALALAARGDRVGVLDADFYGPDVPAMVDAQEGRDRRQWALWRGGDVRLDPVERYGLKLMSAGFLLGERQAFPASALTLEFVLRQLVFGVEWGTLDYLIVDLPPGTADLQEAVFRAVPLAGAIVVVTPQHVAHLDARKVVSLLRQAGVPILGAVENMCGLTCPCCGTEVEVFPRTADDRSIVADGIPLLASFPIEPAVARAAEDGRPLVGSAASSFGVLAEQVAAAVGDRRDGDALT